MPTSRELLAAAKAETKEISGADAVLRGNLGDVLPRLVALV